MALIFERHPLKLPTSCCGAVCFAGLFKNSFLDLNQGHFILENSIQTYPLYPNEIGRLALT